MWLAIMILISLFIISVGSRILDIHLAERNWLIKKDEFMNSSANHLYSIWEFQSSMALFQKKIDQAEYDRQSFEAHYLMNLSLDEIQPFQSSNIIDQFSISAINFFRNFTNTPSLPTAEESSLIYKIYTAVYLIINNQFEEAQVVLTKLINDPKNQHYEDQLYLHLGFCAAMVGDNDKALKSYQYLIDRYKNSPKSTKARQLTFELKLRLQELKKLDSNPQISNLKQLATLNSCDQVLSYKVKRQRYKEKSQIYYAKGVCNYKSGNTLMAADNISKSLFFSTNLKSAKEANRQLFLVSRNKPELKSSLELSKNVNTFLKDSNFSQLNDIQNKSPFTLNSAKKNIQIALPQIELNTSTQQSLEPTISSQKILKRIKSLTGRQKSNNKITKHSKVAISTINNRNFTGELLSSPKASIIKLKTLIGTIRIPKSQIKRIKLIK